MQGGYMVKHLSIPISRIKSHPEEYKGLILPSGDYLETTEDVIAFTNDCNNPRVRFGKCSNWDRNKGCLGHDECSNGSPNCFDIVVPDERLYEELIKGDLTLLPLKDTIIQKLREGDIVRAIHPLNKEKWVLCVVTYTYYDRVGIFLIKNKKDDNGKTIFYL